MKKIYSKPETLCIDIKMQQLMAGSIGGTNVEGLGYSGDTESAGVTEAGSRGGFWDDED
ncbi:MAG: hypothetical protein IKZ48_02695 [Prevotella sp.]|nr:hypothetical protein [Prevotella sp.]